MGKQIIIEEGEYKQLLRRASIGGNDKEIARLKRDIEMLRLLAGGVAYNLNRGRVEDDPAITSMRLYVAKRGYTFKVPTIFKDTKDLKLNYMYDPSRDEIGDSFER